ncbi:MAG: MgtC/SapB family protein [Candidatus Nanoarchaeia archaeon]|nr:MgtC/SapB family protein [Candidatus Nanoarchaeia archaeon]
MEIEVILLRFLIIGVLSFLFGLERQRAHKPIGFGTFVFVASGACGLAMAAITLYPEDPISLLGAIVTGIGFLGAGALIKTSDKIFGFNTAASIWAFAIIGLIIGTGQYVIGGALYIVTWFIVFVDRYLERRGIGSYRRTVKIFTNKMVNSKDIEIILASGVDKSRLITTEVNKSENKASFTYLVEGLKEEINSNLKKILEKSWCESIKVE